MIIFLVSSSIIMVYFVGSYVIWILHTRAHTHIRHRYRTDTYQICQLAYRFKWCILYYQIWSPIWLWLVDLTQHNQIQRAHTSGQHSRPRTGRGPPTKNNLFLRLEKSNRCTYTSGQRSRPWTGCGPPTKNNLFLRLEDSNQGPMTQTTRLLTTSLIHICC